MTRGFIALAAVALTWGATPMTQFREHTIAEDLKGAYQVVAVDLNKDGRPDLIALASNLSELVWFENPGTVDGTWRVHTYTRSWTWPHVFIAVADINGDGRADIALAPAEHAGERYRFSWFEAPQDPRVIWQEHV